ncbi:MAG: hypothetical protein R3218_06880 [Christiangramia sp.]|nr:hypothetical protein [Christiangramia sp.]
MAFKKTFQTLTLGGLLFILPVVIIIILVIKAIHLIRPFAHSFVGFLGIDTIFGKATIGIISILFLVMLCFVSGMLIHKGIIKKWNTSFNETIYLLFPGLKKLRFSFLSEEEDSEFGWTSILLKRENIINVAFITHKSENDFISIFIPDAPDLTTGEVFLIKESNCTYQQIPRKSAMKFLREFGKGLDNKEYLGMQKL